MSHYKRGILDGVVHYCDKSWWTRIEDQLYDHHRGTYQLYPWCHQDQKLPTTNDVKPTSSKREMVTCLLCLGIRRKRT